MQNCGGKQQQVRFLRMAKSCNSLQKIKRKKTFLQQNYYAKNLEGNYELT